MSARVSVPREHGGLVTIAGSALLAAAVAPEPGRALAAASVVLVAFLARGPIERSVAGARARAWDRPALLGYAAIAALALALAGSARALPAAVLAIAIPIAGGVVRRMRAHRSLRVEALGMAALGGAAGAAAFAGGAGVMVALAVGVAMAAYGGAAAPLVRAEVRRLSSMEASELTWVGVHVLVTGAVASVAFVPAVGLAFAPRVAHAVWRGLAGLPDPRRSIGVVVARECCELAAFVALMAAVVR